MPELNHDQEHWYAIPAMRDQETSARLDELLESVKKASADPDLSAQLVSEHVGHLMAGVQQPPQAGNRALYDTSDAGLVRWLQLLLHHEIDRVLLQLSSLAPPCTECARQWSTHLLQSRGLVDQWAWARETDTL
jgi:hypothetical protein